MKKFIIFLILFSTTCISFPQKQADIFIPAEESWAERAADSFIARHPGAVTFDSASPKQNWNYEQGLILEALHQLWLETGNKKYFNFIKANIDKYVEAGGSIRTYEYNAFTLDDINPGRQLLTLYKATKDEKYKKAAGLLRKQLANQPRTPSGGFWHKKIYPNQMWLDGLYMAEPFYAQYAKMFDQPKDYNDIINQFVLIYDHTRDPKTGLLYHGWDESKKQKWANPATGCSPNFWSRAMGWYEMALVDVLDFIPKNHPGREKLISILRKVSAAVLKYRDPGTKLWYQVTDQGNKKGNYFEASASCMFTYAFAKGANKGYLDKKYFKDARESFDGIVKYLVKVQKNGLVDLYHTCKSAGLGGHPYRDGSFEYYISEPQRTNDMKGVGPFILASLQLEKSK